jgi:hypothetical protein
MKISHEIFRDGKGNGWCKDFKKDYRPTDDYIYQMKNLVSNFEAYQDYVQTISDYSSEINLYQVLNEVNADVDFNDIYYHRQLLEAKKKLYPLAIVTHDGDFRFSGIDTITANFHLLQTPKGRR